MSYEFCDCVKIQFNPDTMKVHFKEASKRIMTVEPTLQYEVICTDCDYPSLNGTWVFNYLSDDVSNRTCLWKYWTSTFFHWLILKTERGSVPHIHMRNQVSGEGIRLDLTECQIAGKGVGTHNANLQWRPI